jgi:proline iminopeptidase
MYKPWFAPFTDICQVVYLDYRAQGRSDESDPSSWNLPQWSRDLRAFCDALEIERPIVLGTSFGGYVAIQYAATYPEHPAKLILVSTQARFAPDRTLAEFERLGGHAARQAAERFLGNTDADLDAARRYVEVCVPLYHRRYVPSPDEAERIVKKPAVATHFERNAAMTFDLRAQLSLIRCPTLVLVGDDDPIEPLADSEDIVALLTNAPVRFEHFANAGHPVYEDEPRAFDVMRDFILSRAVGDIHDHR